MGGSDPTAVFSRARSPALQLIRDQRTPLNLNRMRSIRDDFKISRLLFSETLEPTRAVGGNRPYLSPKRSRDLYAILSLALQKKSVSGILRLVPIVITQLVEKAAKEIA